MIPQKSYFFFASAVSFLIKWAEAKATSYSCHVSSKPGLIEYVSRDMELSLLIKFI